MRPPTSNVISQAQHGPYKAVDYSAKKNGNWNKGIYAPEDLTITRYFNNGDAGLQIQATGAHGRHGFAHTESISVPVGAQVSKGQLIGTMGYTGLTAPDDVPEGTHLHWTIRRPDGTYVYPPSIVTEPFGSEGNDMPNDGDVDNVFLEFNNRKATDEEKRVYTSKSWSAGDGLYYGKVVPEVKFLETKLAEATATEFVQVGELFIKK